MKANETSSIAFGTTRIDYAVRRTARVKTISIAIDPEHGVVVAAPRGASIDRLDAIVRSKAKWIASNVRAASDRPPPMDRREFISGETYLYAGRQHRLRVMAVGASAIEGASLEQGRLMVRVAAPAGLPTPERAARVRALLVDWYRERAEERLRALVEPWSEATGCTPKRITIVEQRRRWGSCTASGELRLNWRVTGATKRVAEYVIAHELVHLRHPDHTRAFWRALERAMPDFAERRAQLRAVGPRLVW